MFVNVLGHMLLPVLAFSIGNSCPKFVSKHCGRAHQDLFVHHIQIMSYTGRDMTLCSGLIFHEDEF